MHLWEAVTDRHLSGQPNPTYTNITDNKLNTTGNHNIQIPDSIHMRIYLICINEHYIIRATYAEEMHAEFW
jgi:hypothetical protein